VKLGARPRCALRMMWEISRLGGEDGPVSLAAVSKRCHISRNSLAPLALRLRNRGLLRGIRGSRGGYRLGRPSREIAVGEIIEASAGPLNIVECVGNPASCVCSDFCECRDTYAYLNRRIKEVLDGVTLGEIQDPAWCRSRTPRGAARERFDSFINEKPDDLGKAAKIDRVHQAGQNAGR
jgi:Rrf2 family iron-sulfur cluster assembly transcriptional regulator